MPGHDIGVGVQEGWGVRIYSGLRAIVFFMRSRVEGWAVDYWVVTPHRQVDQKHVVK
jgi:hypothetical protein